MSNITGSSSTYISNADFMFWLQEKTDGLYSKLGNAMDISTARGKAEDALNTIKGKIADLQAGKANGNDVYAAIHDAIATYGDEFPEVKDTLGPIAKELEDQGAKLPGAAAGPTPTIPAPPDAFTWVYMQGQKPSDEYLAWELQYGAEAKAHPELVIPKTAPQPIAIDSATATRWQDQIKNRVDDLSKQDQLALITIQEYNSQLNQAKQTASALMDSADKSANAVINNIG